MSDASAARIGSVPYLNARPLIFGIEDRVALCTPARLADLLHRRQFDVGLVPVAEVLLHDQYDVVDGIAIASRGPVASVFLVHRVPIEQIKQVAVDPASRTSAWLVRVVLKYRYHVEPEFYPLAGAPKLSDHEAMMLFGDGAIWYRHRNGDGARLDLGDAWSDMTGLPFVYAVWAMQKTAKREERTAKTEGQQIKAVSELVDTLRKAKADGLAHIEEIVQNSTEASTEFRREYLTRNVVYELGDAEKRAIRRFQQYLNEMALVEKTHDLRYVS